MLKYDRIDISEGIDVNRTDRSKECTLCHYWYFLNKSFKYRPEVLIVMIKTTTIIIIIIIIMRIIMRMKINKKDLLIKYKNELLSI